MKKKRVQSILNLTTMKNKYLLLFYFILSVFYTTAQNKQDSISNVYTFSLDEAKNFALGHNTALLNARLDKTIAKKQVWETTAIGLPQVSAAYKYQHIPGEIPSFQINPAAPPIKLGVENSATYNITVSQLIFSGEYLVGLQASKTFLKLSENNLIKNELDVETNVASSYFTILALEKSKEILDSSVTNLKSMLAEMTAMNNVGMIKSTDVKQFTINLNTTENALETINRQLKSANTMFKITLGLEIEDSLVLTQNIDDLLNDDNIYSTIQQSFDVTNNIDYKIITTQEKIAKLSYKREQSKYLPSVSAFYLYQDKTNKPDFDFTINNILGVNINIPIFSSGQRHSKVQQANLALEKTTNIKNGLSENLKMAYDQTKYLFLNAHETLKTQKQNIELSKEIYNNTIAKYKTGTVSSLDLTQAHSQYLNSQASYINALLNYVTTKNNLEKLLK